MNHQLPTDLGDVLELALADLEKAERDPKIVVDMGTWFQTKDDVCVVCLAGAVMRYEYLDKGCALDRARFNPGLMATVGLCSYRDSRTLEALDHFRRGCLYDGLRLATGYRSGDLHDISQRWYERARSAWDEYGYWPAYVPNNPKPWWRSMWTVLAAWRELPEADRRLVSDLRTQGDGE